MTEKDYKNLCSICKQCKYNCLLNTTNCTYSFCKINDEICGGYYNNKSKSYYTFMSSCPKGFWQGDKIDLLTKLNGGKN